MDKKSEKSPKKEIELFEPDARDRILIKKFLMLELNNKDAVSELNLKRLAVDFDVARLTTPPMTILVSEKYVDQLRKNNSVLLSEHDKNQNITDGSNEK